MKKTILALLLSTISLNTTAQNVVIFGDSLSDIGQQSWAHKASYYQNGKAHLLYNEILASQLGTGIRSSSQGGTNYAYSSGVAIAKNSQRSTLQPNVVLGKQVQAYLTKEINPSDLHILWIGGNDMAAILKRALSSKNPINEVLTGSTEAATEIAKQWAILRQAGIETAILPTVPNVVYTPSLFQLFGYSAANILKESVAKFVPEDKASQVADTFAKAFNHHLQALNISQQHQFSDFEQARLTVLKNTVASLYKSPLGQALATKIDQQTATQMLIKAYQQTAEKATQATALFNEYTTIALNKVGGNIIRLDIDTLFKDMLNRPESYGLINTTGVACETTTKQACTTPIDNADQMLFADSFHPNIIAHQVMADYIRTTLSSPKEIALLSRLGDYNHTQILDIVRTYSNQNRLQRQMEKSVSAFVHHQQQNEGNGTYLGIKAQFTPEWQISTTFSRQKQQDNLGNTISENKTTSVNATLRYDKKRWWVGAGVQVSRHEYQTQRSVKLGKVTHNQNSEANGATISASGFTGYEWQLNKNVISALADITYSQNKIAAFGEKNIGATRLDFAAQKSNNIKTAIGVQYQFQDKQFQPFISSRWIRSWINKDGKLGIRLNNSQFNVRLPKTDRNWVNLQLGANYQFAKIPLNLTAYLTQDLGKQEKIGNTTANLGLNYQF